jgi:hypothetical protein
MLRVGDPQGLGFALLAEYYDQGRYGWPPAIAWRPNNNAHPLPGADGSERMLSVPLIPTRPPASRRGLIAEARNDVQVRVHPRHGFGGGRKRRPREEIAIGRKTLVLNGLRLESRSCVAARSSGMKPNGDGLCAFGTMMPDPGSTSGGSVGSRDDAYTHHSFSM